MWLWDETRVLHLIETEFPSLLAWYLSLQLVISKCDAARAFILHAYGGVYADCDFDPNVDAIQSFYRLASDRVVFIGSPWYGANNFLIASPPKAPFWLRVYIPRMKQALESPPLVDVMLGMAWSTWPVLCSSGPVAVSRMLAETPHLAFATPPQTEYVFGFHGTRDKDSNSSWYRFRKHRMQQGVAFLFVLLACVGAVSVSTAALKAFANL